MERAHRPILEAAGILLDSRDKLVLDLGCGNGMLLKSLTGLKPHIVPCGIDLSALKISHAQQLMPGFASQFSVGDIFSATWLWEPSQTYDLVLLMVGRLRETSPERAHWLRQQLRSHARRVFLYAYNDFTEDFIASLARENFSLRARYGDRMALAEVVA
jgi:SAM-dependent methyltransferase